MDPLCTNMTHMFVALLQDTLNEYAYAAELAGISYNFHGTIYGLTVRQSAIQNYWNPWVFFIEDIEYFTDLIDIWVCLHVVFDYFTFHFSTCS